MEVCSSYIIEMCYLSCTTCSKEELEKGND